MSDAGSPPGTGVRIGYLDNIRVFLTALVVLHHFAITYGAPGWWFYIEQPVAIFPLLKFLIFAPVAVLASFAVGHLARMMPGLRRIL